MPEAELNAAVTGALRDFFGPGTEFSCEPVAARKSARGVFKLRAGQRAYALRLGNLDFGPVAWASEIDFARLAEQAGVGPTVHVARPELALTLTDWIEPAAVADAMAPLAASLRALHACAVRQPGLNLPHWLGEQARELLPTLPAGTVRDAVAQWDALSAAVQPLGPAVPCHQDPNPANICFAQGRAWLIDWESAGAGDRFFDLASVANWFLWEGPLLTRLLDLYLHRPPSERELRHLQRCRSVHFTFLLIASLRDTGWIQRPAAAALAWREYLLQPDVGKRWREPDTIAQRQATLAREILSWHSCV